MANIERCWIWTTRDRRDGQVQRGVVFHEPEASRAYVDVEEYVRADLHAGAVDLLREARFYVDARATGSVKAAELLDRIDAALPPTGGQ